MKKLILLLISLFIMIGFTGCSTLKFIFCEPDPFTHEIREKYEFDSNDLKNIQYYLSEDIILTRELNSNESTVTEGHSIKIVNNKRIEEILFRKGTPGIATLVGKNYLEISFESGKTLKFGAGRDSFSGKYRVYASEWENGIGKIYYGNKYFWIDNKSKNPHLRVNLNSLDKLNKSHRTAKGRKLGN